MDLTNKYPINQGDIEITVPVGVTGNIVIHTLRENTFLCPVRNGVIRVDEEVAETLLSGNKGQSLPGYSKTVLSTEAGGGSTGGGGLNNLPTREEIIAYLTGKQVKFHPNTGDAKLQALYAAEMAKESGAAQGSESAAVPLTLDGYNTIATESLQAALSATTDADLIKQLIALEANEEARQDRIDLMTTRLTELAT
jgi:hypothetical protein